MTSNTTSSAASQGTNDSRRTGAVDVLTDAAREPRQAIRAGLAVIRGHWYKLYYRLTGRRFKAGRGLRVFGRLKIHGPGEVIFGDRVSVSGLVTPYTHAPNARITIGNDTGLDAVRFGCKNEITIGNRCMIAECRIMDTDFHSTRADRRQNPAAPARVAAVRIADNVWVGLSAGLLPGTVIGENSVVSFGAVCSREYPANSIIAGNPARVVSAIQSMDAPPPESPASALPVDLTSVR